MAVFFIKKILQKEIDDSVHRNFTRFSKGIFENKAILNISRNGKIKISGTYDIVNDLVMLSASLAPKVKICGIVISRTAIPGLKGSSEKKGVFNYELDEEIDSKKLVEIIKTALYCLLDCKAEGIELKTKKTLPRPSLRGTDKINDKFCSITLDLKFWNNIKDEFLFDAPEGKKFRITHTYHISEIILPKNEKDYKKIRLLAKKKGKIIRKIEIDGKTITNELNFEA